MTVEINEDFLKEETDALWDMQVFVNRKAADMGAIGVIQTDVTGKGDSLWEILDIEWMLKRLKPGTYRMAFNVISTFDTVKVLGLNTFTMYKYKVLFTIHNGTTCAYQHAFAYFYVENAGLAYPIIEKIEDHSFFTIN